MTFSASKNPITNFPTLYVTFQGKSVTLCGMEQKDFRGLGRDAQEARRSRAVYLVRTLRKTQAEAGEAVGARRQAVIRWLKRYAALGEVALLDGRRVSPRK